jgi:hypothetical protein
MTPTAAESDRSIAPQFITKKIDPGPVSRIPKGKRLDLMVGRADRNFMGDIDDAVKDPGCC